MKYYNLNGKLPHITYEYTVAAPSLHFPSAGGVEPDPLDSYDNLTINEVKEKLREGRPLAANHSRGGTPLRPYSGQSHVQLREEAGQEEGVVWDTQTPSPPPPAAILAYRPADISRHNDVEPPAPPGYRKFYSHLLRKEHPLKNVTTLLYIDLELTCFSDSLGSSSNLVDEPPAADGEPGLLSFPGTDKTESGLRKGPTESSDCAERFFVCLGLSETIPVGKTRNVFHNVCAR